MVRDPGSPAAMHTLELLALLPEGVEGLLAAPAALEISLPPAAKLVRSDHPGSGRFSWEQVILPRLARRCGASILHLTTAAAPLFSQVPVIVSPAEPVLQGFPFARPRLGGGRLRAAFGRGGTAAARALLWPGDLPAPTLRGPQVVRLPLAALPELSLSKRMAEAGDTGYVAAFVDDEDEQALEALVETWRWAGPAMGEGWALRVACRPSANVTRLAARLETLRDAASLPGALLPEPVTGAQSMARLLNGAWAALHIGPLYPWGDPLLHALAAACPLAAEEAWGVDERVGPAAYLAPTGDRRALGAAILTLLVEENVAEQISRSARERAAGWDRSAFSKQLGDLYTVIRGA